MASNKCSRFWYATKTKKNFILAYLEGTTIYESLKEVTPTEWILEEGTLAEAFPVTSENILFPTEFKLKGDIVSISENFQQRRDDRTFENTGLMINGLVTTLKTQPNYDGKFTYFERPYSKWRSNIRILY
jgi:DNA (cytosine-5)-methyltransferase 1